MSLKYVEYVNITSKTKVDRLNKISSCLHTRQPGTVFKKLDTRQSEILTNFLEMARLIPLRTQDICLEVINIALG